MLLLVLEDKGAGIFVQKVVDVVVQVCEARDKVELIYSSSKNCPNVWTICINVLIS